MIQRAGIARGQGGSVAWLAQWRARMGWLRRYHVIGFDLFPSV